MRTLLQIVNAVIDEAGLSDYTSTVVSNTDPIAKMMLALANRVGYDLSQIESMSEGWPILRQEYTFSTVVSQQQYAFPSDYSYIIGQTEWDRTQKWQLVGPATPQEWQLINSGLSPVGPRRFFRITRDAASTAANLFLYPIPSTVNTIVFEYISKNWCASSGGTPKALFTLDTDVPILDDDLFVLGIKWRYLRAKGLPYDEEFKEYENTLQFLIAKAGASRPLPLNINTRNNILISNANIPDTGFGS